MIKVIYIPDTHDCRAEINKSIGRNHSYPEGTIVECSCHNRYRWSTDMRNEMYWKLMVRAYPYE